MELASLIYLIRPKVIFQFVLFFGLLFLFPHEVVIYNSWAHFQQHPIETEFLKCIIFIRFPKRCIK